MNTDNNPNSISNVTNSVSNIFGKIGELFKPKEQQVQSSGEQSSQPDYTGYGGARSRRRKCNKKHRHTKSCRKYVKKGRKTRKH